MIFCDKLSQQISALFEFIVFSTRVVYVINLFFHPLQEERLIEFNFCFLFLIFEKHSRASEVFLRSSLQSFHKRARKLRQLYRDIL